MIFRGLYLLIFVLSVFLSGCVVRNYTITRDRVDQEISSGNRGFLKGSAPAIDEADRKTTRSTSVVEVELRSPIKFVKKEKVSKTGPVLTQENTDQQYSSSVENYPVETSEPSSPSLVKTEKYTVEKNDTLQKISQKVYGTTKRWYKIYEANRDVLKSPNSIYPGQVINVPVEELKEPKVNLK